MFIIMKRLKVTWIFVYKVFNLVYMINGYQYVNTLGRGYGTEWIYFPDGDGVPHFVNLTEQDYVPTLRSGSDTNIEYRLYTRRNKDVYEILNATADVDNEICEDGCFIKGAKVKILTHGWRSTADKSAVMLLKDAYLKTYDINVIGVDWGSISMSYLYPMVATETAKVGNEIGKFIQALAGKYRISEDQIHLIGHSLGAHVMGIAGVASKRNISRITGLDPARPLFEFPMREESQRLDPTDAQFVDVIHTCAGVLGALDPLGHADFYPNNGVPPQPGCQGLQLMIEACSHGRAHIYFAEAIESPQSFQAYQCKSWDDYIKGICNKETVYMGENVNRQLRGSFYLFTNSQTPFGKNLSNAPFITN